MSAEPTLAERLRAIAAVCERDCLASHDAATLRAAADRLDALEGALTAVTSVEPCCWSSEGLDDGCHWCEAPPQLKPGTYKRFIPAHGPGCDYVAALAALNRGDR